MTAAATPDLTPAETRAVVDMLRACDNTLKSCSLANADKEREIEAQATLIKMQGQDIEALQKRTSHNLLWFIGGVVATGAVVYLVK